MITINKAGWHTSIQDLGRFGYRKYGIPLAGTMDQSSAIRANQLVGNQINDALLEFQLVGPTLTFSEETNVAFSGAHFDLWLNGEPIFFDRSYSIEAGSTLQIGNCKVGMYGYMAIAGGIQSDSYFGSRSFYPTISPQIKLLKGDQIPYFSKIPAIANDSARIKGHSTPSTDSIIAIYQGPEYGLLSEEQKSKLIEKPLLLSDQLSRMGYIFTKFLSNGLNEIITSPVQPGTIQLTPSGQLIILMRDAQTTGGYARIGQLTDLAIDKLAQKRPFETVKLNFFS